MNLSYLTLMLEEYFDYIEGVISNRNQYSDQAMTGNITSILENVEFDKTPLELSVHGIRPLIINLQLLYNSQNLEGIQVGLPDLSGSHASEQFLEYFNIVVDLADSSFHTIELDQLEGNMAALRKKPGKFKRRFIKLVNHAIHHYGQAVVFHGLICDKLGSEK